jgi:hypothetical protein
MKILTILMALFLCSLAQAQLSMMPELHRPIPDLPNLNQTFQKRPNQTDFPILGNFRPTAYTEKQITELASLLNLQFTKTLAPLNFQVPSCESENLEKYLLALQTAGRFDECTQIALRCVSQIHDSKPFLIAALGEASRFQYAQADLLFEMATDPLFKLTAPYTEALFQRASYSLFGHHENLVDGILELIPEASKADIRLWKGILQRVGEMDLQDLKKNQIDQFLEERIQKSTGSLKGLLISLQIRIQMRSSQYDEAIDGLLEKAAQIENPNLWYYTAYSTLYYGLDQNFAWSRKIYDVYNQYAHPWMSLPLEHNTYNYSQLYGSICTKHLVQPQESAEFYQIKNDLRLGRTTITQALARLEILKTGFSNRADYLSTLAGLLALQNQHAQAFQLYWEAHKLCPYYNRAHWGLTLEKRFAQYASRPDFDKLNAKIDRELQGRIVPQKIESYIVNWNSMNADVQKRIIYGSRIWLPYMESLEQDEKHTYIKYAYDLLSDSPELSEIHDERIGGANYPHDNRLWDDVRGVGGEMVVADLGEVYQASQGDYNLLGHEMAHQFQRLMESVYPAGLSCIIKQFNEATSNKNFPDAYSSQNKEEHFAQGVTYYLVPDDSPSRFGLNQNWVRQNNPQQFNFIKSIDEARGDLKKINCPNSI